MDEIIEESLMLDSERGPLAAMLHCGKAREPKAVFAFCNPAFEERKSAYRCFVDAARVLAGKGMAVIRFDYFGTGDSSGDHAETDLPAHLEGIRLAMQTAGERFGRCRTGLLGLRLGAVLAALAASNGTIDPDLLVLWEPVLNGRLMMATERKRQLVRKMMTAKEAVEAGDKGETAAAESAARQCLDLEGYGVSTQFRDELEGLAMEDMLTRLDNRIATFVVQISFRDQLNKPLLKAVEAGRAAGANLETAAVVMPPVWNRLDPFDWSKLIEVTADWLDRRLSCSDG